MHPYRTVKPDDPAECRLCTPMYPGHHLCQNSAGNCNNLATTQVHKHLPAAEYDVLPEGLKPIDGIASKAIFTCDDCHDLIKPICEHSDSQPAPCPKCNAVPGDPCVTAAGAPRPGPHAERASAQPDPTPCRHWHREDCDPWATCSCSQDDPAPVRAKRIVEPPPPPGRAPILLPAHGPILKILKAHGIDIERIIGTEFTPADDGSNVMILSVTMVIRSANGDLSYDTHGRPRTETAHIPLVVPRPTDPVVIPTVPDIPVHDALPPGPQSPGTTGSPLAIEPPR